tara:strand:- start:159 stop:554 length:396 start_codon:yes stop_codon:yes gene_type:complete
MKVYEKKWWRKIFDKNKPHKEDALLDLQAMQDFLEDMADERSKLIEQIAKLKELEKERQVAEAGIVQVNIETQAEILEKILQRYEFFQNDVDINGIRIKRVAKELLQHAKKAGLNDLVKENQKKPMWKFYW